MPETAKPEPTMHQQAAAAFRSALDANRRVTGSAEASYMTALHAALSVAESLIRQQIYDELGHDHYVIFTEDGWTTEHSIECRLSGHMHECTIHSSIGRWANRQCGRRLGRWRIVDATGLVPVLEPADLAAPDGAPPEAGGPLQ